MRWVENERWFWAGTAGMWHSAQGWPATGCVCLAAGWHFIQALS
jgi:hypothetical protein